MRGGFRGLGEDIVSGPNLKFSTGRRLQCHFSLCLCGPVVGLDPLYLFQISALQVDARRHAAIQLELDELVLLIRTHQKERLASDVVSRSSW